MLEIDIKVNSKIIKSIKVVNVTEKLKSGKYGVGEQTYLVDDKHYIKHNFEDKALKLASRVLYVLSKAREELKKKEEIDNTSVVEAML